jgi:hypothetical protein
MSARVEEVLRDAIRSSGLNDEAMSRVTGISPRAIRNFRTGKNGLRVSNAERLGQAFGMVIAAMPAERLTSVNADQEVQRRADQEVQRS